MKVKNENRTKDEYFCYISEFFSICFESVDVHYDKLKITNILFYSVP